MQLREIRSSGAWSFQLALHPRLTVVSGLDAHGRAQLVSLVERSFATEVPDVVLLADTDEGPEPVRAADLRAAGVAAGVPLALRPRDLPGARVRAAAPVTDGADDDEPETVRSARHGVELAGRAEDVSRHALDELLAAAPDPTGGGALDIDAARRRRDRAAAAVASAREEVTAGGGPAAVALLEATCERLRNERSDCEQQLAAAPEPAEEATVSEALAALRAAAADGGPTSPQALALAERWVEHEKRWASAPQSRLDPQRLEELRAQLEIARVELARAEHYAQPLYVDPVDQQLLDEAHEQVRHAQDRASRKMATPLSRRRLEAARAVELGILQRIGVSSYDAYLLRTSPGLGDLDAADRLEQARARLAEAQARWEAAQHDDPVELRSLRRERALLQAEVTTLLGHPVPEDEVDRALRDHRVPVDRTPLVEALQRALAAAGAGVRGDPVEEAESWLAARRASAESARAARVRLEEIAVELARTEGALAAAQAIGHAHGEEAAARLEAAEAELAEAGAALARAEAVGQAAAAHRDEVTRARQELARSERRRAEAEAELAHQLQRHREAVAVPRSAEVVVDDVDVARVDASAAEVYVLARIAALRDVGEAGALPLVLDDPFAELADRTKASLLGLIDRVGSVVQIVYLTEDPLVLAWAGRKVPDGAAVRHFGRA